MVISALRIAERELRETLRDGRVLGMFLLPILTYPAMFWGLSEYLVLVGAERPVLAWEGPAETPGWFEDARVDWVEGGEATWARGDADGWVSVTLTDGGARVGGQLTGGQRRALATGLGELERVQAERVAPELPRSPRGVRLVTEEEEPLNAAELMADLAPMAPMLPSMLLLLTLTMVFYPTLDAAQERGRGTLSTTLLGPYDERSVVWGKALAATVLGVLAVVGQAVAAGVAFTHLLLTLLATVPAVGELDIVWPSPPGPLAWGVSLLALALATLTMSATFLTACIPFRTPQNGQTAASLVMIGLMALLLAGTAPAPWCWLAPVANVTPIIVDALRDDLHATSIAVVFAVDLFATVTLLEVATALLKMPRFRP